MSNASGLVLGLTGGIGAGKSTVAGLFADRGAAVIDVDGLGRAVLEPGGGAYDRVVETFGPGILSPDGRIDRGALAAAVFGAESRLPELEAISHPAINERLEQLLTASSGPLTVLDMAVLVESALGRTREGAMYHRVIVVEATPASRLERLIGRGMAEADARSRMASQASDAERRMVADLIITNDGSPADLGRQVDVLWPSIEAWQLQVTRRAAS